jgi:2-polyprenyl-3-methyl-5-hydroxy-6-metoxy-1,4-benzoquinol methylase
LWGGTLLTGEAVGVDIAPNMLALCDQYAKQVGVSNVTLVEAMTICRQLTGTFDFINSYIVLQHIPPARGFAIVQKLLSLLRPRASALFNSPLPRIESFLSTRAGPRGSTVGTAARFTISCRSRFAIRKTR